MVYAQAVKAGGFPGRDGDAVAFAGGRLQSMKAESAAAAATAAADTEGGVDGVFYVFFHHNQPATASTSLSALAIGEALTSPRTEIAAMGAARSARSRSRAASRVGPSLGPTWRESRRSQLEH